MRGGSISKIDLFSYGPIVNAHYNFAANLLNFLSNSQNCYCVAVIGNSSTACPPPTIAQLGSFENNRMVAGDDVALKENGKKDMPEAKGDATAKDASRLEAEARAVADATASADTAFVPSPSLLASSSPVPLLGQVDGPTLKGYTGKESVYQAKPVPVPVRGRLDVPIHIVAGGSVVEYKVETKNYDISFGVVAEREEGVTIVAVS